MKNIPWLLCSLLFMAGCDFEERVPIEMASANQNQPLAKEESLSSTVRFDIGSLEISGEENNSNLYSYDLEYDKASYRPDIQYDGGTHGRFSFELRSINRVGVRKERNNNRLHLALNNSVPLDLKVNNGVGDARLSLSGLKLSRVELESGVGGAKITAYEPNPIPCEYVKLKSGVGGFDAIGLGYLNFGEFEFQGGVGGADLDFSGEWKRDADIRIKVGVGGVNVRLPREIGVRVDAERNFLSGVHLEGFNKRDSYYYSENYESAPIRISVRVEAGVGGLRITWL